MIDGYLQPENPYKVNVLDADGQGLEIKENLNTGNNELLVNLEGHICAENSTDVPLSAGKVFTGDGWQSTLDYGVISIDVVSDQDSATDGLAIQWSNDALTVNNTDEFTIYANTPKTFTFGPANRYVRLVYTNGSVDQTTFSLTTILRRVYVKPSSHRINDNIVGEDDAELIKSVLSGQADDGLFKNITSSQSGRLNTNSQPYTYAIAEGDVLNHNPLLKFGTRTTVSAGNSSSIWEGPTNLYAYMSTAQQLKVSSTSANDIATTGTGARTLFISGLNASFEQINETINMNGATVVTTTLSYIRVFRSYVETCGSLYTNSGTISIKNNAGTVTQAIINIGDSQTLMSLWTVPIGHTFYMTNATFSSDSNKGARASIFTRDNDGGILYPWRIRYRAFTFSGNELFPFTIPFSLSEKTDIEIRVLTPGSAGATSGGATFEGWYELD